MDDEDRLDREALAELQDVMEDEFVTLIHTYLEDSDQRIRALHGALRRADHEAFAKSAHSLKGSSVNIGVVRLGKLCEQAELAGREGHLQQGADLLDAIEHEFAAVRSLLEQNPDTL